jgi:hypothetical protein
MLRQATKALLARTMAARNFGSSAVLLQETQKSKEVLAARVGAMRGRALLREPRDSSA